MHVSEYKNIFENEETHFFYTANHVIILTLLEKFSTKKGYLKILDAGCGTGLLAQKLERYGSVIGLDINPEALKFAKKRGVKTFKGSVDSLPFKDNSFDVITSMDVIYHKQVNDDKALSEFFRVLVPGGFLILRVPANNWIRTNHDKHVHTRERYSRNGLKKKFENSGFIIKKLTYINLSLLPLAIINQIKENVFPGRISSGVGKIPDFLNSQLTKILINEEKLSNYTNLPFGLGLVAVCQKPQATKYPLVKSAVKINPKTKNKA